MRNFLILITIILCANLDGWSQKQRVIPPVESSVNAQIVTHNVSNILEKISSNTLIGNEVSRGVACIAGTFTDPDSVAICSGGTVTIGTNGDESIPDGGEYVLFFQPGVDGTGAGGTAFGVTAPNPITIDAGLNGFLAPDPDMAGTWRIRIVIIDSIGDPCDFSTEIKAVNWLSAGEPSCAPPDNDTCESAITLACGDTINASTSNASADFGLVECNTDFLTPAPGVWYTYLADGNDVTFSLCGSDFDTQIGVYGNACNDLICLDGSDDFCSVQSEVTINTAIGTTYFIYVTGFESFDAGDFTLIVSCPEEPCDAGTLANPGPVTLCPGEETTFATTGDEAVPTNGTYYIQFIPGNDGSGGPNDPNGYTLPLAPPYIFTDVFINNPPMRGTWYVQGSVSNSAGTNCSIMQDSMTVVFLDSSDIACAASQEDSCAAPTTLSIDNVTTSSADFSWTGSGSSYDVELVDITDGGSFNGSPTETDVSNPHTFSNLADNNDYEAYVRSNCAEVDMVISGVIDATLPQGRPKAIELYVINDIADLSKYGVGSANNGGGTDGIELELAGSASAGDFIYIASHNDEFITWFGFTPDYVSSVALINGDDAVELFKDSAVVDLFGIIDVDGNGEPWEYQDGWAYRNNGTGPDGSTFVLANWSFSGVDELDGDTLNSTATPPFPVGSYVPPVLRAPSTWEGPIAFKTLEIVIAAPANDTCGGAITVTCSSDIDVSGLGASDADAPSGCSTSGAGLWYSFAGDDQAWDITATPSGWDNELHVYSGSCGALSCEDWSDAGLTGDAESVTINTASGTTYYIYVGGWGTSVTSIDSFNLSITCIPLVSAPANDTCGGAITVTCSSDIDVSGLGASDADAPSGCSTSGAGLWYSFAGDDQAWDITATPSGWDNELHVYSGSCGALSCEDWSDAGLTGDAESVTINTASGTTYYIYVGGWGTSVTSIDSFNLSITCIPLVSAPANDTCGGAITVTCSSDIDVSGLGASDADAPSGCSTSGAGLWYSFAGDDQAWDITATPSGWDNELHVYSGSCGALSCEDWSDAGLTGDAESVTINTASGTTYYIYVGGWGTSVTSIDSFNLSITCIPLVSAPANDTCGGAITVTCSSDIDVSGLGASDADAPSGCSTSGAGLWYSFAGDDQAWDITATPSGWDNELHVYSGSCGALSCEDWSDGGLTGDAESVTINTASGTTYYIYVGGWGTSVTSIDSFNLSITCIPLVSAPANDTCGGAITVTCSSDIDVSGLGASDADAPSGCSTSGAGLWYSFAGR